jgi:hypothetical protein
MKWWYHCTCQGNHSHVSSTNNWYCLWKGSCFTWNLSQNTPEWFEHALHLWPHGSKKCHQRVTISGDLTDMVETDLDILIRIIRRNETWWHFYDPQIQWQSSYWKPPTLPKKQTFPADRSNGKVMLKVFFDSKGILHQQYIPQGHTLNNRVYRNTFRCLRDTILWKHPELWQPGNWDLHQDNGPAHWFHLDNKYLVKYNRTVLPQPPHSPILPLSMTERAPDGQEFISSGDDEAATKATLN